MCLSIAIHRPNDILAHGEHKGFEWMVIHNGTGFRCGYVRLPKGHPWHGKDMEAIECTVHGGLSFAEPDLPCDAGGPDDAYWIGFDCCHSGDLPDPSLIGIEAYKALGWPVYANGVIRSEAYAEAGCQELCDQAAAATTSSIEWLQAQRDRPHA
jgi:hypothetical protein